MVDSNLLIVGSVALDSVRTPFGEVDRVLGGTAVYASTSASHYCKPAVVGVVGEDFPQEHEDTLKSKGVDTTLLEKTKGKTFHWKGYYEGDMNEAITEDTQLGVFEQFSPKITDKYANVPFVFLGNIHPQLQLNVLEQLKGKPVVGMDTMNLWINNTRKELDEVIKRVTMLFVNDGEAALLTGKSSVLHAADDLLEMGPEIVIIKKGSHGAMVFTKDNIFSVSAIPLRTAKDPTGAGDTFAGGMMGYLGKLGDTSELSLRQSAVVGTVMASFTVEDFSLNRLGAVTPKEVAERIEVLRRLSDFGNITL